MEFNYKSKILSAGNNWSITRMSFGKNINWRLTYNSGQLTVGPYRKGKCIKTREIENGIMLPGEYIEDASIEIKGNIITIYAEMCVSIHVLPPDLAKSFLGIIEKFNKSCLTINEIHNNRTNIGYSLSDDNLVLSKTQNLSDRRQSF